MTGAKLPPASIAYCNTLLDLDSNQSMTNQLSVIYIFCRMFLNIEHLKVAGSEQILFKNHFDHLINIAFKYIGKFNRIILMTGNDAVIVYMGSAEEAMLMTMDIVNGINIANKPSATSLSMCIGIHLEPARAVEDMREQSTIIAAGINAAKQIARQAKSNEILVSRAYYENAPLATQALSTLFDDSIVEHENHLLDYQTDLTGSNQAQADVEKQPPIENQALILTENLKSPESSGLLNTNPKRFALASLFVVVALVAVLNSNIAPTEPDNTAKNSPLKPPQPSRADTYPIKPALPLTNAQANDEVDISAVEESAVEELAVEESAPIDTDKAKANPASKQVKQKTKTKVKAEPASENNKTKETISWKILKDSIKQGQKNECTQTEIALNQCD